MIKWLYIILLCSTSSFAQETPLTGILGILKTDNSSTSSSSGESTPSSSELTLVNWVIGDSNQTAGRQPIDDESGLENHWTTNPSNGLYTYTTQDSQAAHNNHLIMRHAYTASTAAAYATRPLWDTTATPPNEIILSAVYRCVNAGYSIGLFDVRSNPNYSIILYAGASAGIGVLDFYYTDTTGTNIHVQADSLPDFRAYSVRIFVFNNSKKTTTVYVNGVRKYVGAFNYTTPNNWRYFGASSGSATILMYEWKYFTNTGSSTLAELEEINSYLGTKYNIAVSTITE